MSIDKPKLYQAISNLINNAIKYSYDNSTIDLRFKQNSDDSVTISVEDHGIGIPENVKGRIFDKFFRAENAIKVQTDGTGLGVYFARAIVLDHGGKMWFDSVEGEGTTFTAVLPIK
jgi:signal transduction histidine kinase